MRSSYVSQTQNSRKWVESLNWEGDPDGWPAYQRVAYTLFAGDVEKAKDHLVRLDVAGEIEK